MITEIPVAEAAERILAAARSKTAASFIRFNDGEARLVGNVRYFASSIIIEQVRRLFGDNALTDGQLASLGEGVLDAVRGADITALPPADWPINFACARDIVAPSQPDQALLSTHVDIHQHLFNSDFFSQLFELDQPVSLVTCRDVRRYLQDTYAAALGDIYTVPEQADGSFQGNIAPHYPLYCDWLCSVLEQTAHQKIFLVGAGICGKLYCQAIKRGGGVAIDVGSIFDLWAGRFSRPYMDAASIHAYYINRLSRLDLDPGMLRACAEIYTEERNFAAALRVLQLAQQTYPEHTAFRLQQVAMLLRAERTDDALHLARECSEHLDAPQLLVLGRLLKNKGGMVEEALPYFLSAFRLEPLLPTVLLELCHYLIGHAELFDKELRTRILSAAEHVALTGVHPLLFQVARVHGSQGDLEGAIEYGHQAITLFSMDAHYISHQIAWLKNQERHTEADYYQSKMDEFVPEGIRARIPATSTS